MTLVIDGDRYQLAAMAPAHLPQLLAIEQSAQFSPWSEADFLASIHSSHHSQVLMISDQVIAYCITSTAADEAELLNIAVAVDYRRRGIGQALLNKVCHSFDHSIHTLFLEVRESNGPAIALYQQLGFNEVGRRPHYYPAANGREHGLIMAKTFDV